MDDEWTTDASPFHEGEQNVQERLGVRDIEEWARRVVRPYLTEQHRDFYKSLPFLIAAALDEQGRPWATLLTGPDGFIESPERQRLIINDVLLDGDPLSGAFKPRSHLGLLGIELASRRRNRVNGRVNADGENRLVFNVDQAFGNCPQYIREREWTRAGNSPAGTNKTYNRLTTEQCDWIATADTFFIASGYVGEGESPTYGMDASHRGGESGFVQVVDDKRILFPDFAGNNHFNTIGNIVLNSKIGCLFVDFPTGSLLHLTGRASIAWDSEAVARSPGARRIVNFEIDEVRERRSAIPLRWEESADFVRTLRLIEKIPESDDVTSFVFESRDGAPLPDFEAGQYLPIELDSPDHDGSIGRTYSLSGPPGTDRYRISVKREPMGIASRILHDELDVGAIIEARRPAGEDLILPCVQCPVVLISVGVGITPMLSLLHALAEEGNERLVWFVHGARDSARHVMARETRELAAQRPNINLHFAYSRPLDGDELGSDFDSLGRVDGQLISGLVAVPDAHYLLCGPTAFMAEIHDHLERNDVVAEHIHTESFGPKS